MNNFTATQGDRARAQNIQKQYLSHEENKMEQLKRLDGKVKAPGKIVASVLGVAGALTMGAGMSMIMVQGNMAQGLVLGIPGLVILLLAYPLYALVTGSRKKKYAAQVINLSSALMRTENAN